MALRQIDMRNTLFLLFIASSLHAQPIEHLLSRVTFGSTADEAKHAQKMGVDGYINDQLHPASIDDSALDSRLAALSTLHSATPPLMARYNPQPVNMPEDFPLCTSSASLSTKSQTGPQPIVTELQRAAFLRAVYTHRQLYERMVGFWENHFNVYINKDADRLLLTSFDRDTIRPFALGNFRQLLGAVAHAPAMLYYLDNWQSGVPRGPATGKPVRRPGGLNENYARELLELHTLGVDGGYTQQDVEQVARCFTGWTIYRVNDVGLFMFDPAQHDDGEKIVLGRRIPPGGGIADGEIVLDILAQHPSTAHFIATKLARMFVSDTPPQSLVRRAAAAFTKSNGSIAETVRAILTSREFRRNKDHKVKSPFEYAVSAVRALGAETDGGPAMLAWVARMGQPIFGRPSPDGYPDRAKTWMSAGMVIERVNFAIAVANNQIAGTRSQFGNALEMALLIGSPRFQLR